MRAPRPYQLSQFDSVRAAFKEGKRHVIVESPTGTGKTVSFVLMSKMVVAKKKRVLILVNRNVLVEQTLAELRENDLFAAREQAEERASLTAEVVVGSIQSLDGKWLARWPKDHFGLVILDECHGSGAASFKRILDHFESAYHCGFTATPERHDKKGLWKGYSDIVFSMSLKEAIDDGWLCGFEFVDLDCPVTLDLKLAKHASFSETEEVFDSAKYLPRLADCAMSESAGRKGLFFLPNCRVSNQFTEMLKARGMKAEHIDSSYMPAARTEELLRWFKGEKEAILCNSDLLSVGFNQPDIDLVGLFRPIASTPMYKQRLGRGTRPVARIDDYATADERKAAIAASAKPFCIAEGTLVATDRGYVPIEEVTKSDLVWDGTCFCKCDGAIYMGEKETIEYCGLAATPDHKVWDGLAWRSFSECAEKSLGISLAGDGRSSIWKADNLFAGNYQKGRFYVAYGDTLRDVRGDGMALEERPNLRTCGMHKVWTRSPVSKMVNTEGDWAETALRKPKRSEIYGLWREGNPIQFFERERGVYLDRSELRDSQTFAARSNRKQWSLRTWEFEMVYPTSESITYSQATSGSAISSNTHEPSRNQICGCNTSEIGDKIYSGRNYREIPQTFIKTKRRVWDILNCGPLHRFTANGLIVSNCKVLNVFWENGSHDLASPSCLITDDEEERKALDKERKAGKKVDLAELENQLKAKRMENEAEEMRKFAEKVANSQEKKRRTEVYVADILKSPKYGNPASEKQYRFLYVLSKRDFRKEQLTSKQASRIIGRYQPQSAV